MLRSDEFLTIIDFVFRNFPRDKEKLRRAASFITRQRVGRGRRVQYDPRSAPSHTSTATLHSFSKAFR